MAGKIKKKKAGSRADLRFYILMSAFPILQFVVFYILVNVNSFAMAFQEFDTLTNTSRWVGVSTIRDALKELASPNWMLALKNSLIAYLIGLLVGTVLALLFSYYIYKKLYGSMMFRVMLFLPSVLSSVVMVAIYKVFAENLVPELLERWFGMERELGFLGDFETVFMAVMIYHIFMGFGVQVLMYSNAMAQIDVSVVEAAHMDGCTGFREFIQITIPMIFPTLETFVVVGVVGLFTNQLNLYSFFGENAIPETSTYGYLLYVKTVQATQVMSYSEYNKLAAIGIIMTVIVAPLTFLIKWLLEKYGPSSD